MKKYIFGLITGILVTSIIGVTASYVYRASDISYSPSDENWNVTNASEALSSLKGDVDSLNQYRSDIVESLVDKGVDVNENSSMADIKNGIENMGSTDVYYLGTGTSFNIKTLFPNDYQNFTNSNFIVKFIKTNATNWTGMRNKDGGAANTSPETAVTVSYNSETGALTVNGTTVTSTHSNNWDNQYYYLTHTVGVYLVIGDINNV